MKARPTGVPVALALAALLAVVGASAAEPGGVQGPPAKAAAFVQRERPARCAAQGLNLCGPGLPSASSSVLPGDEPRREPARLTRFTRLAGMFMGRVDAVRLKRCRVRINLEIK